MKKLTALLLITAVLASCNSRNINGNGKIVSRDYHLKDFTGIDIGGQADITITQGNDYYVRIETDENLIPVLQAHVADNVLNIEHEQGIGIEPTGKLKIYITLPELKSISLHGASTLATQNKFTQQSALDVDLSGASSAKVAIHSPKVSIDLSGASELDIAGETRDVTADISGASTLSGYTLKAENCRVDASGASTANVYASLQLTADASGASRIKYKGKPQITGDNNISSAED